jgi:hypothetical protein
MQVSAAERSKGQRGEREVAKLIADHLGFEVKRQVRQHDGDSDLVGVPGWSIEVKNHKQATRAQVEKWWYQAVAQGNNDEMICLAYKRQPGWWRFVWHPTKQSAYDYTLEGAVEAWACYVREQL